MIAYAIKNTGESNEKLLLRYKRTFFQTRTLNNLKANLQHQRKTSARKVKISAIVREHYRDINRNTLS
jgi:hypothetical protein